MLPDDITRCHDVRCEARQTCARWLDRRRGGRQTRHAQTLKYGWLPHSRPCISYIEKPGAWPWPTESDCND